jgi:guanine nucleotide-binding protein subunit alpha
MEARRVSAQIDADINAEQQARRKKRIVRLLLLGQSESGKSTTLRQFQRLYTPTAFHDERILWRAVIQLNIVRSIRTILYALDPTSSTSPPRRRFHSGIMALAEPSSPPQPATSADVYNYDSYYAGYNNNYASASGYASDEYASGVDSDPESDLAPEWEARLLPLRHVEALLIARLVPPHEDEPTRLDFGGGLPPGAEVMKEIFVRPGNRWNTNEHQKSPANSRSHGSDRDEAQEALNACAPAMMALWADPGVRAVLRRRKVRLEEGPGL